LGKIKKLLLESGFFGQISKNFFGEIQPRRRAGSLTADPEAFARWSMGGADG
jgi:hypothetical protein